MISPQIIDVDQGTDEWLSLRKTKITATDAPIIMGASHFKTRLQLYREKVGESVPCTYINPAMQRGTDLEPLARDFFAMKMGISVLPAVFVRDWTMASLDGIDTSGKIVVEIKCPGEKDHQTALDGNIPDKYMPQLQHQMYVCDIQNMHYLSFDGLDGVILTVDRDEEYIEKMIAKEFIFYIGLQEKIPPEMSESDYVERDDTLWDELAYRWRETNNSIKELEEKEVDLRKQLIFLSGEINTKGSGISLCQVKRKGNVDYSKVPELKGVDLDPYRKSEVTSWRISCHQ